jgi:hypothetical protein
LFKKNRNRLVGFEKKFDWINSMEKQTEKNENNEQEQKSPPFLEPLPNFFETIS